MRGVMVPRMSMRLLGCCLTALPALLLPPHEASVRGATVSTHPDHLALREVCLEQLDGGDLASAANIASLIATGGSPDASMGWTAAKAAARFGDAATLLDTWWKAMPRSAQRKHAKRTRRRQQWLASKADSGERHQQLAVATVSAALAAYQAEQLRDRSRPKTGEGLLCDAAATLASAAEGGHTDDTLAAAELLATALLACPLELAAAVALEAHARSVQTAAELRRGWPPSIHELDPETVVSRRFFARGQELQGAGHVVAASATYAAISSLHRGYRVDGDEEEEGDGEDDSSSDDDATAELINQEVVGLSAAVDGDSQQVWAALAAPRVAKLRRIYEVLQAQDPIEDNASSSSIDSSDGGGGGGGGAAASGMVDDVGGVLVSERLCDAEEAAQLSVQLGRRTAAEVAAEVAERIVDGGGSDGGAKDAFC